LRCRTFFASGAPSDHRPGDADPALKQIYLRVTQPTANSEEADIPPGKIGTFVFQFTNLSYAGRMLNRIIILAEKQRRIWEPKTRFFAYAGVYPIRGQQGIAFISDFRVDFNRSGRLVLVLLPDPENVSGNMVRIAGQFEFL
jgi:hypothetical protein